MEEDYCSFELAKKLFEKGMPQELDSYYGYAIRECYNSSDYSPKYNVEDKVILGDGFAKADIVIAPTLSLVQKWLREEKKIYIEVTAISSASKHNSYEEALEAGINKALELI